MYNSTKIKERIDISSIIELIKKYNESQIECSSHTFFRLSQKQRKIFNCEKLKRILVNEEPFLAGIQYNKNYAIFYKYNDKTLRIILTIDHQKD